MEILPAISERGASYWRYCQARAPKSSTSCWTVLNLNLKQDAILFLWTKVFCLFLSKTNCEHSFIKMMGATSDELFKCRGAPWISIPGSNTQSTVAYLGPLYGKVVGVAIYSIHNLYSTVNIIIFGQNWQPDKDTFVTVCICMNYFKRNKLWKGDGCFLNANVFGFKGKLWVCTRVWENFWFKVSMNFGKFTKEKNYYWMFMEHTPQFDVWSSIFKLLSSNKELTGQYNTISNCFNSLIIVR